MSAQGRRAPACAQPRDSSLRDLQVSKRETPHPWAAGLSGDRVDRQESLLGYHSPLCPDLWIPHETPQHGPASSCYKTVIDTWPLLTLNPMFCFACSGQATHTRLRHPTAEASLRQKGFLLHHQQSRLIASCLSFHRVLYTY